MATQRREVTLPTGRKITIKPFGQLEAMALASMPNLVEYVRKREQLGRRLEVKDVSDDPAILRASNEYAVRTVILCTVEPRWWADLRPIDEQDAAPRECPEGREPFDLTVDDFQAAAAAINAYTAELQAKTRELADTGFSRTESGS